MNMKLVFVALSLAALLQPPAYAAQKATANLSIKVTGLREGTFTIVAPTYTSSPSAIVRRESVPLTTATGSIVLPSGTSAVAFIMPAGNTKSVTIGGASGPVAGGGLLHLGSNSPFAFIPVSSSAALVASASAAVTITVWFF